MVKSDTTRTGKLYLGYAPKKSRYFIIFFIFFYVRRSPSAYLITLSTHDLHTLCKHHIRVTQLLIRHYFNMPGAVFGEMVKSGTTRTGKLYLGYAPQKSRNFIIFFICLLGKAVSVGIPAHTKYALFTHNM